MAEDILTRIHNGLKSRGLKVALAESCTGGYLGHLMTMTPGSSAYFLGSIVCYSDEVKVIALGINPSVLQTHGAISPETANAMAIRARAVTGADIGLSVTGILGPDAVEGKPVGTVYAAISTDRGTRTEAHSFTGSREDIRYASAVAAMTLLAAEIESWSWT